MTARLVVSVSGPGAAPPGALDGLAGQLDRRSVPLSLLVSPHELVAAPHVAAWVLGRVARGDVPVLRGPELPLGTAVLPAHETRLRLVAARAAFDRLGLGVAGYAQRGRLVPPGTLEVLRRNGFTVCAERRGARNLATGELLPGRVIGPGRAPWHGERTEPWWCRAMVLNAARLARLGRLVRIALPGAALARPAVACAVLDAVDIALHHDATPTTYPGLVGPRAGIRPR